MSIAYRDFLKICNGCGEIFDANIEAEAVHHNQAEHAPLLPYAHNGAARQSWSRAPPKPKAGHIPPIGAPASRARPSSLPVGRPLRRQGNTAR